MLFGVNALAAPGDVIGNVYPTDIVTYMYYAPITSYNIGGKTCIDAEILTWHYGFDVYWLADERHLDIDDKGGRFVSLQAMSGEIVESSKESPQSVGKYYETDIITTLNGNAIERHRPAKNGNLLLSFTKVDLTVITIFDTFSLGLAFTSFFKYFIKL